MASSSAPPSEDLEDLGLGRSRKQRPEPQKKRVEYYAEENFVGANLKRSVHIGWGACIGAAIILACMGMSAVTQGRSWNVSFLWLQRRVGAQFGTLSYIITCNSMYYHDGDKWVTRDWANFSKRFQALAASAPSLVATANTPALSRGFAADALSKEEQCAVQSHATQQQE